MNRQEKIDLIKGIAAGDPEKIKELKKERGKAPKNYFEDLEGAFKYLASHGPIDNFHACKEYWIKLDDLAEMMDSVRRVFDTAGNFDGMPDRALFNWGQCGECVDFFQENNFMHLLKGEVIAPEGMSPEEIFLKNNPSLLLVYPWDEKSAGGLCWIKEKNLFIDSYNPYKNEVLMPYSQQPNRVMSINDWKYKLHFKEPINWPK